MSDVAEEVPHMPTKEEILEKAIDLFKKEQIAKGLPPITPTEDELKEGNWFEAARIELMSGLKSQLEEYLAFLESEAESIRDELGIKPPPPPKEVRELEEQVDSLSLRLVETRRRLLEAKTEIERLRAVKIPPKEVVPPRKELTKEEIRRLEDVFRASLSAAGLYPPRFISEFRVEIDALKFLPFLEARRGVEEFVKDIIARAAPPRIPTVPARRIPYPYIPPALEAVELEPDFKVFLTECGITMDDYRRLEHVGKLTMREEYRRWKARPYS